MKCPKCDVTLMIAERTGIEIDWCPECRGVWLDRGELDKIIDRSSDSDDDDDRARDRDRRAYEPERPVPYGDGSYKRKKRKSLLGELFDF